MDITIHGAVSDWGKQAHRWTGGLETRCGRPCGWTDGPNVKLITGWTAAPDGLLHCGGCYTTKEA